DDQHRMPVPGMGIEQIAVDAVDEDFDAVVPWRKGDAEFDAEGREQFPDRQVGIEDVGDVAIGRDLLEQTAAYRRLARTHFAGEQHEATVAVEPIQQMSE